MPTCPIFAGPVTYMSAHNEILSAELSDSEVSFSAVSTGYLILFQLCLPDSVSSS